MRANGVESRSAGVIGGLADDGGFCWVCGDDGPKSADRSSSDRFGFPSNFAIWIKGSTFGTDGITVAEVISACRATIVDEPMPRQMFTSTHSEIYDCSRRHAK